MKTHKEHHLTEKYRKHLKKGEPARKKQFKVIDKYTEKSDEILELGPGEFPYTEKSFKVDLIKNVDLQHDLNKPLKLNKKFDIVIGLEIIEHLHNHRIFLESCYNNLREDGFCILSTPNIAYWKNRLGLLFGKPIFTRKEGHVRFFTPESLKKEMEKIGFKIVDIEPIGIAGKISINLCGDFVIIGQKR